MKHTLLVLITLTTLIFGCNTTNGNNEKLQQLKEQAAKDSTQANFEIRMAKLYPDFSKAELDSLCEYDEVKHDRKYPHYKPYRITHTPVDTNSMESVLNH